MARGQEWNEKSFMTKGTTIKTSWEAIKREGRMKSDKAVRSKRKKLNERFLLAPLN